MKKYLDIAKVEKVVIQRGRAEVFVLSIPPNDLPDDFERGITKDELMIGVRAGIRKIFREKQKE
jgi:hypothetical protein